MRRLKVIFLALSTLIVLLHSFTPHSHHESSEEIVLTSCNQTSEAGILGLFQFLFHQDLGAEHLENFVYTSALDLDLDLLISMALVIAVITLRIEDKEYDVRPYLLFYKDSWRQSNLNHRGPPYMI